MKAGRLKAATVLAFACAAAFPAAAQASAWTATVLEPAYARAHPDRGATLDHVGRSAPHWGGPNVLLVLDTATVDGVDYVKVLLKRMPAGSAGWIEADRVEATASSHGCVRIPQAKLTRLLHLAPRGTPVLIRR